MTALLDTFNNLPAPIRADLFRTKIKYPTAFLSSIAKSAPFVFHDFDAAQVEGAWDDIKDCFEMLTAYAGDFFEKDAQGKPIIPDHVYETFGVLCHNRDNSENMGEVSEKAAEIIGQINRLRWDPYPRQADYAGDEARFLFLLMNFINSFTYASFYASVPAPRQDGSLFYYGFLCPMRTLDESASLLEHDILQNIQRIEFMLDHEDHPHYAEPLSFIRGLAQPSLTAAQILEELKLPVSERTIGAIKLAHWDLSAQNLIDADKTLTMLLCSCAHTKLLLSCMPDLKDQFAAFSMALPFIKSPTWEQGKYDIFDKRTADKFETWYKWAVMDIEPPQPLSPGVKDKLSCVLAASDIVEMERIALLFKQNERQIKPVNYESTLLEAKISLMRIRDGIHSKPITNADLNKLRTSLLFSTFTELHALSESYAVLKCKMDMIEGTPIIEDFTP